MRVGGSVGGWMGMGRSMVWFGIIHLHIRATLFIEKINSC